MAHGMASGQDGCLGMEGTSPGFPNSEKEADSDGEDARRGSP